VALDAPLRFVRTVPERQSRRGVTFVGSRQDVQACLARHHAQVQRLSILDIPGRAPAHPKDWDKKTLAPEIVFAAAKSRTDLPDLAVGLALAGHLARSEKVSLVVMPRYLEADPKLEHLLRTQHELVQGGVVLGQSGILSENTRALLREVLTSPDQHACSASWCRISRWSKR
jgi:hypothetical protein